MLRIRFFLMLLAVALALCVALVRPLAGRADNAGDPQTPPSPDPAPPGNATPIVPPLPIVQTLRRPASVEHHARALSFGIRVIDYAKRFIGTRYVYGGSSPRSGFDCSGFVRYVFEHFGISLAHSSWAQFDRGRRVSRRGLEPGDLVFFDGEGHVGIYVGDGRFIHAPHTGTRVQISSLAGWYDASFDGGRRLSPR